MAKPRSSYHCYTDGSCKPGAGAPGGWGYVIKKPDGTTLEGFGSATKTQSKVMEYTAVAEALKAMPAGVAVTLFSDSESLIEVCRKKLAIWVSNGWKNVDPEIVTLVQEIARLTAEKDLTVEWIWIRSHGRNEGNLKADALAAQGAREAKARLEAERGRQAKDAGRKSVGRR